MVFTKTLHILRPTLTKGITHGYAQSVVAGVQSSYASQNNSFGSFGHSYVGRYNKNNSHRQNAFSTATVAHSSGSIKANEAEHAESGLAAYYAAWQTHQKQTEKDWQQFQFAKRIEWKAPSTVPEGKVVAEESATGVHEVEVVDSARNGLERSYSTSAVDDFRKAIGDAHSEEAALAQIDAAIAEEAAKGKEEVADVYRIASPVESASRSPASDIILTPKTSSIDLSTSATSASEADSFADQLHKLAAEQRYGEIPAVFESMLSAGIKPTASGYNALLTAAIKLPRAKHQVVPKALDVYSDMLRRRVAPDVETYTTLVELLAGRAVDVVAMKNALHEKRVRYGGMEVEGKFMFRSNETELDILAEDDSVNLAIKLFDSATASKTPITFVEHTYRLLVTACAQHGRVEDMVRVYSQMEIRGVKPSGDLFVPMVEAFAKVGDLRSSVDCYDEYKALAIADFDGAKQMIRRDYDVYASVIKAYGICGRLEGGKKFMARIEADTTEPEHVTSFHNVVGLNAMVPQLLAAGEFDSAIGFAQDKMTAQAQRDALVEICTYAADRGQVDTAIRAWNALSKDTPAVSAAMAMDAMHIRSGRLELAEPFWSIIEASDITPQSIEATVMHAIALVGSGHAERSLYQTRQMFARIRSALNSTSRSRVEAVEQIDEAIEVIGQFMVKRGIVLPAQASMELMRTMIDNGGLVPTVAEHVLAGLGPESTAKLGSEDVVLLTQVEAGMLLNNATSDIAHSQRFAHLLELVMTRRAVLDNRTGTLVEKALIKLDRPDFVQRWHAYLNPIQETVYSPVQYQGLATPVTPVAAPAFDDSFDPYASTTDNKGSVAITDLLEKTHGRSASHLNEALIKFKNMRRAGRHPRFFTYAKLITAAAKEDRLSLAHDILALARQDVPYLPQYRIVRYGWVTILDAMVAACLTTGQRQMAAQFHQDLLDMGAAPSANTFGLYITTLKESTKTFDEATEAVKIFLRAKSEGVEPSSFLYNALIGKLGKARRIDDCLFYFSEMRNLGIRPTSVTYGTIVNALCRVSDEKFAEELFEEMESMPNYKPRPAPYHSMMQFFLTTRRDRSKVLDYYERMRAKKIQPTTHTYKLLIDTYATLDPLDMTAAESVLEQIRQEGAMPEAVHYASLIHAKGCVLHDMEGARKMFDAVLADRHTRPQACLYQALFESMVANHQVADTEKIVQSMRRNGVEMTPYIANSLIHGWALAQDIGKAQAVYDSLSVAKREPSTYEAMTRAFMAMEDRRSAMDVVNEGLSRGYPAAVAGKILELVGGGKTNHGPADATA